MSPSEVLACVAVFAWALLVVALSLFHRFVMKNNSTAGRGPTPEELEAAIRKTFEARVNEFKARIETYNAQVHSLSAHATLGVSATATQEEIKAAYRHLRSKHHPDRGGDADAFHKIQVAYEQLIKPTRCPQCEGTGKIHVRRGAFVDISQCPRCWPTKEGEK